MKKLILIFTLFSLVAIFTGCSSPEPKPMAGGIYTAEYDTRGEAVLNFALSEMELGDKSNRVSLYKKQIVNGTNHFFIVKVEEDVYEIKVYESLNGTLQLESQRKID